jgi:hypothetical protein
VAGFVPQDAHQPIAVTALHFAHEAPLDAHEPPVREIERDGDAWNAVGRKPFLRQPAMRTKADTTHLEFVVQT